MRVQAGSAGRQAGSARAQGNTTQLGLPGRPPSAASIPRPAANRTWLELQLVEQLRQAVRVRGGHGQIPVASN